MRLFFAFLTLIATVFATTLRAETPLSRALNHSFAVYSAGPDRVFLGSAFSYAPLGVVVTNAHVVTHDQKVILKARDGAEYIADVLAQDLVRDVAVLSNVRDGGLTIAVAAPGIGTEVFALGAPLEHGFSVNRGIISADPRQIEPTIPLHFLQHDAATNPGSSGGPLVDADGRLVGMSTRIADGSRLFVGLSFAISASDIERLVAALLDRSLPPVLSLGVDLRPLTKASAKALGIPSSGALVDDVMRGGLGDLTGLRPGDVILSVAGKPLETPSDLPFLLESTSASSTSAKVLLWRNGRQASVVLPMNQALSVTPSAASPPEVGLETDAEGRVLAVTPNSRAQFAGVAVGDRVVMIDGTADLPTDWEDHRYPALLLLERDGRHLHVIISNAAPHPTRRWAIVGNRLDSDVHRF